MDRCRYARSSNRRLLPCHSATSSTTHVTKLIESFSIFSRFFCVGFSAKCHTFIIKLCSTETSMHGDWLEEPSCCSSFNQRNPSTPCFHSIESMNFCPNVSQSISLMSSHRSICSKRNYNFNIFHCLKNPKQTDCSLLVALKFFPPRNFPLVDKYLLFRIFPSSSFYRSFKFGNSVTTVMAG